MGSIGIISSCVQTWSTLYYSHTIEGRGLEDVRHHHFRLQSRQDSRNHVKAHSWGQSGTRSILGREAGRAKLKRQERRQVVISAASWILWKVCVQNQGQPLDIDFKYPHSFWRLALESHRYLFCQVDWTNIWEDVHRHHLDGHKPQYSWAR